jgi:hypothetical protein
MSDPTISMPELAGACAFCVLVLDKTFSFVSKIKNGKNGNGSSGEKSVDYWKTEFRVAVREELDNQGLGQTLKEIRDEVKKLVTLEELRQRDHNIR